MPARYEAPERWVRHDRFIDQESDACVLRAGRIGARNDALAQRFDGAKLVGLKKSRQGRDRNLNGWPGMYMSGLVPSSLVS